MTDAVFVPVMAGSLMLMLALPSLVRWNRRRVADLAPTAPTPSDYSELVGTDGGVRFERRFKVVDGSMPHDNAGPPSSVG